MGWISSSDKYLGEPFFKPTYPYEKCGKGRPSKEAKRRRELYDIEYADYISQSLIQTGFGKLLLANKENKLQYNH